MPRFTADCWFLTGPTASGKSAVALKLAERLGAEIIAMDSMTLYKGLAIGTAKPALADRARVRHHLLDVLKPWESASVDWYLRQAESACNDIRSRGRQPLFVGGTPLYLKAALRGLFAGPPADLELRAELEAQAARLGSELLHQQVQEIDSAAAQRIHPGDVRRLVRALEVYRLTGRPISAFQQEFAKPANPAPKVACILRPRAELYDRINHRVVEMLDAGWIDEVLALLQNDHPLSRQAAQAVGYCEIIQFLRQEIDYPTLVDQIQTRTRQFCKRQLTWFRHLEEITFFETDETEPAESLIDRLIEFFSALVKL